MNRHEQRHATELDQLIEQARIISPLPDTTRARALARARESLARASVSPLPLAVPTRRRWLVPAMAASIALGVMATGAVAAYHAWTAPATEHTTQNTPAPTPPAPRPTVAEELPPSEPDMEAAPQPVQKPHRATRPTPAQVSYAEELALLQRAQAAYADQNFGFALSLLGNHARRFPKGLLQEEREALRVRSLAGAGRSEEAKRAAAAFAARFPRSVLLPRLSGDSR